MVSCVLSLILNNVYTAIELKGYVVEEKGDYVLVDFGHELTRLKLKTEKQVYLINYNRCLKVED